MYYIASILLCSFETQNLTNCFLLQFSNAVGVHKVVSCNKLVLIIRTNLNCWSYCHEKSERFERFLLGVEDLGRQVCVLWPVACGLCPVVCGMWHVACGLWPVACGLCPVVCGLSCGRWPVVCSLWHVACGLWSVACGLWSVACGLCPVACCLWPVACVSVMAVRLTGRRERTVNSRHCTAIWAA
jgi:hypothetical protein